nr:hypothetical protein [Streptomyces sp. SID3212]
MEGFFVLCEAHLSREETEILCGWSVLVRLAEEIWLSVGSGHSESTMVVGPPQVLPLAERLAAAVDNLGLSTWFTGRSRGLAQTRTGPWGGDLDAAFYIALFLRAAQHSVRHGCPVVHT